MDGTGNLILDFFDVYGERPDDRVDVQLKHQVLSQSVHEANHPTTKSLRIAELDSTQGGTFNLQVFPLRRRPVSKFLRVFEDKTVRHAVVLPIDAGRVTGIDAPPFDSLGDDVTAFTRLRGDRFFAKVAKELRDAVKNSIAANVFSEAPDALHTPPPGFEKVDSFKTPDLYGNLQLTFFSNPTTLEFLSDTDIDDAQGGEHIFQVLRPILTGKHTNPYDIHEILLEYQKVDP